MHGPGTRDAAPTNACGQLCHLRSLRCSESTRSTRRGGKSMRCCTPMTSRPREASEENQRQRTKQRTDDGPSRSKHGSPPRYRSCSHGCLCGLRINNFQIHQQIHTESVLSAISISAATPSRLSRPLPRQKQHRTSHSLCWHHPHRNIQPHFLCSCRCIAEGVEHVQTARAGKHVQRSPLDTPDKSDHCRFLARL